MLLFFAVKSMFIALFECHVTIIVVFIQICVYDILYFIFLRATCFFLWLFL